MLVRHLCFNQNSYLKTENLLFLHIRSSRSKSLEHQDSPCLFSRLPVCILAHMHICTYAHMYIRILTCILAHLLAQVITRAYIHLLAQVITRA